MAATPTRPMSMSLVVLATVLLASCGRQASVTPPTPDAAGTAYCSAVTRSLPWTVAGVATRPVQPGSPLTAAWGDPPIVLRCGVPRPAGLEPTSPVVEIDAVTWFAEPVDGGRVFTAVEVGGAVPAAYVEVAVPDAYAPQGAALVDIGPALRAAG